MNLGQVVCKGQLDPVGTIIDQLEPSTNKTEDWGTYPKYKYMLP